MMLQVGSTKLVDAFAALLIKLEVLKGMEVVYVDVIGELCMDVLRGAKPVEVVRLPPWDRRLHNPEPLAKSDDECML